MRLGAARHNPRPSLRRRTQRPPLPGIGTCGHLLDKDIKALADLEDNPLAEIVCADLETGAPFPLQDRQFNGVVVTNYLWRDILSDICGAVAPGGLLIYETFGTGNEAYGRPRNPDFLLKPGELLETVGSAFDVLGYDHGLRCAPSTAVVQRIAAVKR